MTDENPPAVELPQGPEPAGEQAQSPPQRAPANSSLPQTLDHPEKRPYLQVFGPDTGVFEFYLPYGSVTVGRSDHADIWLPHNTVSRVHATVSYDNGEYVLEDANSNFGTTVNNKRIESHVLRHGDSIQISLYVLQYRTHAALPGASAAAAQARLLLRSKFGLLPSTMRLRLRPLEVAPSEIFRAGDTLTIGHGGLLIPAIHPPEKAACLELQLFWPNNQTKRYLGEILGIVEEKGTKWMCVKLHMVPKEIHEVVIAAAKLGAWSEVAPT
jgi:hypothetical protein